MSQLFLELLKLSISASFLIVAVVLLRVLMKKAPKYIYCILWALVAIRLICPISFESSFSVMPRNEIVPAEYIMENPIIIGNEPYTTGNNINMDVITTNTNIETNDTQLTAKNINYLNIFSYIWIVGTIGILLYGTICYIRLKKMVSASINVQDNIYICDDIKVPFIFGIIKPKIYLPSNMSQVETMYVLLHEKAHLSRHDNLWKPLGFLLLSIYWFNPLVWISYHLFSKDIELATDEKVIRNLEIEDVKGYSETLLSCSLMKSNLMIRTCPVAFGEVGVKDRIKAVLNYKKPRFWIVFIALLSCVVVGVCFFTKPVEKLKKFKIDDVKKIVIYSYSGKRFEIDNIDMIQQFTNDFNSLEFTRDDSSKNRNGFGLIVQWYDGNEQLVEVISIMSKQRIEYQGYYWNSNNEIDISVLEEWLDKDMINHIIGQATEFQNIMGYNTYYKDTESAPHFYTRDYYTKVGDQEYLLATSFGIEQERGDIVKDIDGDGISELICNCTFGGDGHESVYIFMSYMLNFNASNSPSSLMFYIDDEKLNLPDFFNWGVNAISKRYDADTNRFAITYCKGNAEKNEYVTIYYNENEIMDKLTFEVFRDEAMEEQDL